MGVVLEFRARASESSITKIRYEKILKVSSFVVIALFLLAGMSLGILWVNAASSTPVIQYGPKVLSGSATDAKEPAVQTSANGQYVYVSWTEGSGGIYSSVSSNGGNTWSTPLKISKSGGTTQFPVMITGDGYETFNSGDVYVAWAQTVSKVLQIFVASSTNNGASFKTAQVSTGGGITPALAASGSDVYVTWFQNTPCPVTALNPLNATTGTGQKGCIYVDSSTSNGGSWSKSVELNPSSKGEAQVVAEGNDVYVTADGTYFSSYGVTTSNWDGNGTTLTGWTEPIQVYGFYSYDPTSPSTNCNSFPPPTGCLTSFGREPWIAASGLDVYVTWEAVNLSSSTALYSDYGVTSTDGGVTWYPGTCNALTCSGSKLTVFPPAITTAAQQAAFLQTGKERDVWEPENAAVGSSAFTTFHSLSGNAAIYVTSTSNNGGSWTAPVQVNTGLTGTSAYAHIFSSDGSNVWVLWGQVKSGSVWNAYVSYSGNGGSSWSAPLDISNNAAGVAAGNQDVTLFWVASIGTTCFAVYTYTSGSTSQVWFTSITA
jgi:hypothetical protein